MWEDSYRGEVLISGAAGHAQEFIGHPKLVAEHLRKHARLVSRAGVVGGTGWGLGNRLGGPRIARAKIYAMAECARLARWELWGL